jgi:2-polyprenyl-3-methyl-5-hydroxy-6-metoxy-1,4-benzoquinol methylase
VEKKFNLNREIKNLLLKDKFYLRYNRNLKIRYEKNYHYLVKDPDGKTRNLLTERKLKLSQMNYILSFLKKQKPCKILDVGCGHGWLLSTLSEKWKKFGVEISKFASASAGKYCKIFNGDLSKFNEKNFDIITTLHTIEHHKKPEEFLKDIYKKLKKGGVLILETPDFDSAAARRYNNNFRLLKDKTHVSLFSTESLIRFVRKNKFKLFDINFPYFETPFFTKKNILRLFNKSKVSPPFYGSVVTLFLKK